MTVPPSPSLSPIREPPISHPGTFSPPPKPVRQGSMEAHHDTKPMDYDDYEALPPNFSILENCFAGAFAGIATRLQVLKPAEGGLYTGLTNAFLKIRKVEGSGRMWRGISSVILGAVASGGSATIASDALMNPFDVIKQRMQVHGSTYRSVFHCLKSVYRNEGVRAFYASYPTTIAMTVPFTALQFMAYENLSELLNPAREYSPNAHIIAGGMAGGFAAALTTPLDVIKTLLQTRGSAHDRELRLARGLFGAASIIRRQQGWRGFFRGLQPRILTAVPSTAICWSSYELAKNYFVQNRDDAL
ncbi:uncharacterized protein KY384_005946 [Bacidia gigantensis]|uniref:uncharacterized protein n=1 Tax=Bacidia gigantensis TaxID=2732470 RepID=UPI001D05BDD8|nr:uncharacterized protein KY384_005946 [Bacidia gigantensis]KAG8529310.1 hypothetical protein KY384_005946 [Bacidia gigantensis]